jgi:hypothetical protein
LQETINNKLALIAKGLNQFTIITKDKKDNFNKLSNEFSSLNRKLKMIQDKSVIKNTRMPSITEMANYSSKNSTEDLNNVNLESAQNNNKNIINNSSITNDTTNSSFTTIVSDSRDDIDVKKSIEKKNNNPSLNENPNNITFNALNFFEFFMQYAQRLQLENSELNNKISKLSKNENNEIENELPSSSEFIQIPPINEGQNKSKSYIKTDPQNFTINKSNTFEPKNNNSENFSIEPVINFTIESSKINHKLINNEQKKELDSFDEFVPIEEGKNTSTNNLSTNVSKKSWIPKEIIDRKKIAKSLFRRFNKTGVKKDGNQQHSLIKEDYKLAPGKDLEKDGNQQDSLIKEDYKLAPGKDLEKDGNQQHSLIKKDYKLAPGNNSIKHTNHTKEIMNVLSQKNAKRNYPNNSQEMKNDISKIKTCVSDVLKKINKVDSSKKPIQLEKAKKNYNSTNNDAAQAPKKLPSKVSKVIEERRKLANQFSPSKVKGMNCNVSENLKNTKKTKKYR